MAKKSTKKAATTAAEKLKPKRTVKAPKAPVMCAKAEKLKQMREMMNALKKESDRLKKELIEEFGIGVHPGFSVVELERETLSQKLLMAELGDDLSPYKTITKYNQIDFH